MSWNNDNVLEFLELYKKEQLLWDPKHPLHRNRSEVTDAWLRIQLSLSINCSIPDLKKKKESLMTSFRMHLNKKKSQEGYHTTWFAYPLMESFLGGKYECDSTNHMENEFFETAYNTQPVLDHNSRTVTNAERINSDGRPYKTPPSTSNTNVKPNPDLMYPKKKAETSKFTKNAEKREMDEYDLYGQLLAKKLRKLDEHQRDVTMHEIDNLMFRAKMQSSSSQARRYSPSPVPRKEKSPVFIGGHSRSPSRMQYQEINIQYQQDHLQPQPPS
ncbi:hypothetical protein ABMA28_001336 [Loxostege sticticalis]|uniref:MADF domain-containing protein n=1 Tax=Loxostege sticticalis TaxID=481309 RepID=A0ABD0T1B1_LOXSC